jgi:hypothetical protein
MPFPRSILIENSQVALKATGPCFVSPMIRPFLAASLLALVLLSGCASTQPEATLTIDFAGKAPAVETAVSLAGNGFPSAIYYAGKSISHPGYYTVHDLLEAWLLDGGAYTVSYHEQFGYALVALGGIRADYAQDNAYWALSINGQSAVQGMSTQQVHAGDVIGWTYTSV